uniref:Putative structural protein n=1 Tax=viral metagenome TaxID=1070528 RepID=A0A6M3JI63_9ZZZZ
MDVVKKMIRRHEEYRETVYLDTEEIPTGGWGHAFHVGSKLPMDIWEQIFEYDFNLHADEFCKFKERFHLNTNAARDAALIDMMFCMGASRLRKFVKMITALVLEDYQTAADEILDSDFGRTHKNRAAELAGIMRTGKL